MVRAQCHDMTCVMYCATFVIYKEVQKLVLAKECHGKREFKKVGGGLFALQRASQEVFNGRVMEEVVVDPWEYMQEKFARVRTPTNPASPKCKESIESKN